MYLKADNNKIAANAKNLLSKQHKDGSWPGINYKDASVTKWPPSEHLAKIRTLSLALTKQGSAMAGRPDVLAGVVAALRFWYGADPKSTNWWHNEIATPQDLGEIILLLQDSPTPLPKGLTDSLVSRMVRGNPYQKTGANKLDIAIHYLYRACITANMPLMDSAVQQAFAPIAITTQEGLQADNSYQQHGPQLQISSYGLVFLNGSYKIASLVRGTPYALSGNQLQLLGGYLVHSFLPAIRGRYIDFNIEGRGLSRLDMLDKISLASDDGLLQKALALHPEYKEELTAAIKRIEESEPANYQVKAVHTHFWRSDYTQHIRPGYSFNVRAASQRTKRTEAGNRENLLGTFLPDGSTNIQRSGSEYFNIMPAWEWDKLPGITARDFDTDQPMTVEWGENGSTAFVGGVSDSSTGVTVYTMYYNGVKAKKAWFFLDKEVVCLGAGIESSAKEPVVTTMNQCWANGPAYVWSGGQMQKLDEGKFDGTADAVWQDSIAYYFPTTTPIRLSLQVQKGPWSAVNAKTSEEEVAGDVFKLWTSHGAAPTKASYAYIVVPGVALEDVGKRVMKSVMILQNTASLQAVWQEELNTLQAVFHEPGSLTFQNMVVAVNKPCALQLKMVANGWQWHLADPSQKLDSIQVTFTNKTNSKQKTQVVALPGGPMAGSTVAGMVQMP